VSNQYRLEKSRAQRILWLLEELNLDYEIKTYKRDKDMFAEPALREVHPLGKSPLITVTTGDGQPRVIAESGLIIEYLTGHFGKEFIPKEYKAGHEGQIGQETDEWMKYRFFMHYTEV
jgi:glutathione S-transferase